MRIRRQPILRKFRTAHKIIQQDGLLGLVAALRNFLSNTLSKRSLRWFYLRLTTRGIYLLKEIQGNKMYLNLEDPGISKDLALDGIREELVTRQIRKELTPGMKCVDIGANIGYYTLIEAQLVSEEGKVYAIEPEPRNFELLKKNIEVNNYDSIVEVYQLAIGNKNGIAKLYLSKHSNLHNMVARGGDKNREYINVEVCKLDGLLKDKDPVDFIRMDIEGYEYEAILGMQKILTKGKRGLKLCMELHPRKLKDAGYSKKLLLEKLAEFGFKPKWSNHVGGGKWADSSLFFDVTIKDLFEIDDDYPFEVLFEKTAKVSAQVEPL